MTCENHCRCDRILSLRSVAQIQTGLNLCDISQRQTKRKRLVAAAVQTRPLVAATFRRDLSHRVSWPLTYCSASDIGFYVGLWTDFIAFNCQVVE